MGFSPDLTSSCGFKDVLDLSTAHSEWLQNEQSGITFVTLSAKVAKELSLYTLVREFDDFFSLMDVEVVCSKPSINFTLGANV